MTREEIVNSFEYQAAKAGVKYNDRNVEQDNITAYEEGAEYGYNFAVEKACDWLYAQDELIGISFEKDFFERFKEAMKN